MTSKYGMFLDLFVLHFRMANQIDMDELRLDENRVILTMSNEVMGFSEYELYLFDSRIILCTVYDLVVAL